MQLSVKDLLAVSGLPAEMQASVIDYFDKNPDAVTKVSTHLTSELATAQRALDDSKAKIDAEWETLSSIRGGDADAIAKSEQRIEDLASKNAVLEARLRKVAADAGVDPETVLKDLTVVPVKKVEPTVDTTMAFDPKKLLEQTGRQAWTAFEQAALVEDLAADHLELFGKPLKDRVGLLAAYREEVKRTGNANLSVRDVWEKTNNVPAKREELRAAEVTRGNTEAYERG